MPVRLRAGQRDADHRREPCHGAAAGERDRARRRAGVGPRDPRGDAAAGVRPGARRVQEVDVRLTDDGLDLEGHLEEQRRRYMLAAMERCAGVQTRAAELLGMTFRSFRYFAKKYDLSGRQGGSERGLDEGDATSVGEARESDPGRGRARSVTLFVVRSSESRHTRAVSRAMRAAKTLAEAKKLGKTPN